MSSPYIFLDHPGPIAFAHRGGALGGLENSMPAFQRAIDMGYRYLETDVHATADGVALVFHDYTLDRVTDRRGQISRLPYAEVAKAKIGGKEPIPRLEDLLSTFPDVRVNIDIKAAPAIAPLAETLHRTNAWDRVCVASFSDRRLAHIRARMRVLAGRDVCTALGPRGVLVLRASSGGAGRTGPHGRRTDHDRPANSAPSVPAGVHSARAGDARAAAGSRPRRARRPRGAGEWFAPLSRLARAGVACAQVPYAVGPVPFVTPGFLATAHELGLAVHVWTVNDRERMERLLDLGVDGIITDELELLRDVLAERGQWHPAGRVDS